MLTFNFAYRQCKISNPRPGPTPGTALRAVGPGIIKRASVLRQRSPRCWIWVQANALSKFCKSKVSCNSGLRCLLLFLSQMLLFLLGFENFRACACFKSFAITNKGFTFQKAFRTTPLNLISCHSKFYCLKDFHEFRHYDLRWI